jgi:ATP-dependent protease HslVU (ClpYQ) peptidase subunit
VILTSNTQPFGVPDHMTCIVGLEHHNKVYIGGDSAGVAGLSVTVRADEKVFINGKCLMGFTSSFRMGQVLRYGFKPPRHPVGKDDMEYLVTDFINSVRKAYKASGYLRKSHDSEWGGTFLLGYKGHLYCVDSDFQVGRSTAGYQSVGCGSDIALGSMYTTEPAGKGGMPPASRITTALQAATKFSGGVLPPYKILSV